MLNLNSLQNVVILSGNQDGNLLTVNGVNLITKGNVGYSTVNFNTSSSLTTLDGINPETLLDYNNEILDLNLLISDIGNLDYITFTNTDIGSISSSISPLGPGNYLFTNPVTFDTTLYLSGNGEYVFYFMDTFTIGNPPIDGYMQLENGVLSDDIFFYSPYNIELNTTVSNSTLYGNFISDLNVIDTSNYDGISTGNFKINGRFLSSTGNINLSYTGFDVNNIACYLEGSLILVYNREFFYKKIEDIDHNDKIVVFGKILDNKYFKINDNFTLEDIIFKGKISIRNVNSSDYPICFKANSLGEKLPIIDLEISPGHRIINNNKFLIANQHKFNNSIFQYNKDEYFISKNKKTVTYYHLECKEHNIICVNGILTESLLDFGYKRNLIKIF